MKRSILLIALLVFVAGCVGSSVNTDANNGLVVNEFSADPPVAEPDDTVRFFLDTENVGGTTAQCVTARLFGVGPENDWRDFSGNRLAVRLFEGRVGFSLIDDNLQLCYQHPREGFICTTYSKDRGLSITGFLGNVFGQFVGDFCSAHSGLSIEQQRLVKFQPALTPPLPERNKPGQSFITEWVFKPPVLPEGVRVDYPVTARVEYFYTSNAVAQIRGFNKAEFKRRLDTGQETEFPLVVENTVEAPIQVAFTRGASPIVVNTDTNLGGVELINYRIEFINAGDGFPLPVSGQDLQGGLGPLSESGFVFGSMSIDGPGAVFLDCLAQSGEQILVGADHFAGIADVKIRSDRTAPIGCTIGLDKARWRDNPVGTITITFQLMYRYFVDAETFVTVIGAEGPTSPIAGVPAGGGGQQFLLPPPVV